MKRVRIIVGFVALFGCVDVVFAQPGAATCCEDCTCVLCGDQQSCGFLLPGNCDLGGTNFCGDDGDPATTDTPCTYFWDNTFLQGEVPREPQFEGDIASENCVPIDGGLGFLIAGGLGIGVIGIRRRKEELVSERA